MRIVVAKSLVPKGFVGITIYPFVFLKEKKLEGNVVLINHERIHLRQQVELFIVFFFVWYGVEFLIRWLILKDKTKAYRAISFEQEAYANDINFNYLQQRKWFQFLKYLK